MPVYPIYPRWSTRPLALVEAGSFLQALQRAVLQRVALLYADLKRVDASHGELANADLRGADLERARLNDAVLADADLRSAFLVDADLRGADLRGADLRGADLRGTDLRAANLERARLSGADLRGAQFFGARFQGAILDWRWSGIPLELLRQHRGGYQEGSKIVAELVFHEETRPFSWLGDVLHHPEKTDWVLRALAAHFQPSDNAPELLRRLVADLPDQPLQPAVEAPPETPRLWIRRQPTAPAPLLKAI
jgi:hypothetical protein